MKDLYFNIWRYSEAKKNYKTDILRSKKLIEDYLEDYPYDYNAHIFYTYLLTALNMPTKAEKLLKKIEKLAFQNTQISSREDKVKMLKEDITTNKTRILAYKEKYQELLDYYNQNKEYIYSVKFGLIPLFCKCKLNILDEEEKEKAENSYLFSQVLNYDEEKFKEHIKKHLTDFNEEEEDKKSSFVENFPIDTVIEEIKKYIPSEKKFCFDLFSDSYYFKYDDCGRNSGFITDYFKVITLHNTDKLITMCPVKLCDKMPHVNLNYLNKDKGKVKTLSQIEKFNRRYRR